MITLAGLEAAGFRGIRGSLQMAIADGFTIVCGRNGSGKSTLIDAVEFALTGRISRPALASEGGEDINNYVWWRGSGEVHDRFVRLTFRDGQDRRTTLIRRPSGLSIEATSADGERLQVDTSELRSLFADDSAPGDQVLERLCATTIIRDEQITELSVDAPERDRFSLVRDTLGSTRLPAIEERIKGAKQILDSRIRRLETEYDRTRADLNRLLSQISDARSALAEEPDADLARRDLATAMGESSEADIEDLLRRARRRLADLRDGSAVIARILPKLSEIDGQRSGILTDEHQARAVELEVAVRQSTATAAAATQSREEGERTAAQFEAGQPTLRALAELVQHGRSVGLEDGRCPLCGSEVSAETFEAHIESVRERIARQSAGLTGALEKREAAIAEERNALAARRIAEDLLRNHRRRADDLERERNDLSQEIRGIGVLDLPQELTPGSLEETLGRVRTQLRLLEVALARIEASAAYDRLIQEERTLAQVREKLTEIERSLEGARKAANYQDQASRTVRRVAGELVDERLAQLEPLLLELYGRLRPHVQWSSVGYKVRGDVMRFLRLTVGESELNPRFMFSSGQRRALGLAFLLSVHLATTWSRWNTLVLDDPMQHVDDYRALHLAEVLAAIRKGGRQVICAVEDESLADLLARRLATSEDEDGAMVQMSYVLGEGSKIASAQSLPRMAPHIITAA